MTYTTLRQAPAMISERLPFEGNSLVGKAGRHGYGQLPGWAAERYRHDTVIYTVVSYATPIGWYTPIGWVVPKVRYSRTTSRHQGCLPASRLSLTEPSAKERR